MSKQSNQRYRKDKEKQLFKNEDSSNSTTNSNQNKSMNERSNASNSTKK